MTTETLVFALTILLALGHILVMAGIAQTVYSVGELVGPRDDMRDSGSVYFKRAQRANDNFRETLSWALGLLILVQVTGDANATTAAGAWIYFWARLAYLPLYLFGIPWMRTGAWTVSLVGLAMLLIPLFG